MLRYWGYEVINIPFTQVYSWEKNIDRNPIYQDVLNEHFQKFLPSQSEKTLVFIDFSKSGGIMEFVHFFSEYQKTLGLSIRHETSVFAVEQNRKDYFPELPKRNLIEITKDLGSVYDMLKDGNFTGLAEYDARDGVLLQTPHLHTRQVVSAANGSLG